MSGPVPHSPFIEPSAPVLRPEPPSGPQWLHEVKHDGWRAQIHLNDGAVTIYGKNGGNLTKRFPAIAAAVAQLPVESAIVDAELVACTAEGVPDFYAIMKGAQHGCTAYCFDVLEMDGRVFIGLPLDERRQMLRRLMRRADNSTLRLSESFDDPQALLAACEQHCLEGIVSKRRDRPYIPGENPGWIKVKTKAWREANKNRWESFVKRS